MILIATILVLPAFVIVRAIFAEMPRDSEFTISVAFFLFVLSMGALVSVRTRERPSSRSERRYLESRAQNPDVKFNAGAPNLNAEPPVIVTTPMRRHRHRIRSRQALHFAQLRVHSWQFVGFLHCCWSGLDILSDQAVYAIWPKA